jgi:opacity protein-like surface antigen
MASRLARVSILVVVAILIAPATSLAGDAFLKLGITFEPDLGDISDKWFISAGSDWGFHPQGFWGLEFQGSYRTETENGAKATWVPANVLLNFKWKSEAEEVRPYAGAGVGLISNYFKLSYNGQEESEWIKDAGFQFMGGVEFNRRFAVELMGQRIFEEGADWLWSFLAGIRW